MIDAINAVTFLLFLVFLATGAGATLSRVVSYRSKGYRRPRLLTRDAHVIGGFALTFLLILSARVLRAFGLDLSTLATNPLWILGTSLPSLWAVGVYAYFEIAVIERGRNRDYLGRE